MKSRSRKSASNSMMEGGSPAKSTRRTVKGAAVDQAYEVLREEIIRSRTAAGQYLDDEVLRRLGLSRTPAREALARLAGEGLVQLMPNRGARVAPLGWTEIREHLEGLDVMQRLVTRWAAIRRQDSDLERIKVEQTAFEHAAKQHAGVALTEANLRFHEAIGAACGNSILAGCYLRILTEGLRIDRHAMFEDSFSSAGTYHTHLDRIIDDHREMVAAIEAGDPDRAETVAKSHADLARRRIGEAITGASGARFDLSLRLDLGDSHV